MKEETIKSIERKIGITINELILNIENCIRVVKETSEDNEHYAVCIGDWTIEHILMLLKELH